MSPKEQIAYLESRLKDNPKSLAFARLADLYLDQNRTDEAIQLCTAGVKHNPSYVTGNYVLAKAYILSEDYENAESALKQVISHDREFLSAHKLLGDLMRKLGWENKAAAHYRDIIQIDPLEEKVRSILESLDESLVEESNDKPDPDPFDNSMAAPKTINPEVSDWINEIKEVFPDEIVAESENAQSDALSLDDKTGVPEPELPSHTTRDTDVVEPFADLISNEPDIQDHENMEGHDPSRSIPERPVISDTPEFFAIKNEEDVPKEKIAAEFLAPEQLSEPELNPIGEEVVPDEIEISKVIQPIEVDRAASSDFLAEEILDTDTPPSPEDEGSDFAQALDALEAMDSDLDTSVQNPTTDPDVTFDIPDVTPSAQDEDTEKNTEGDTEDAPLMYEDSGLISLDDSKPELSDTRERIQASTSEMESHEDEPLFEWGLSDEPAPESKASETLQEADFASVVDDIKENGQPMKDEADFSEIESLAEFSDQTPQITMTPPANDEPESFTPEDLNLDIKTELNQNPVEDTPAEDQKVNAEPDSPPSPSKPTVPKSVKSSPEKTKEKTSEKPPAEPPHAQEAADGSQEEIEPDETKSKASPKIVTPTLGEIYSAQGQYDKALAVFEELLQQHPNEKRYMDKISELKRKLENPL